MAKYTVEIYEPHSYAMEVEAEDEVDTIARYQRGEATDEHDRGSDYIEVADDYGMQIEDLPAELGTQQELTAKLKSLGIALDDGRIPGIRSVALAIDNQDE